MIKVETRRNVISIEKNYFEYSKIRISIRLQSVLVKCPSKTQEVEPL